MSPRLIASVLALASAWPLAPAYAGQPNIVVIISDDLGYADLSFNPHHPKEVSTPPADRQLDGVDLLPYLTGEAKGEPHDRLYWRYLRRDQFGVREGDWKLVKLKGKNMRPQLYDLKADPGEATDLAARHPERVKSLQTAYDAWAKDLPKPLWMNTRDE